MAKRILSAESALTPQTQTSLGPSVRTESARSLTNGLEERWEARRADGELLFDWQDRRALMDEIEFVNRAQAAVDEAAVKLAPSLLRIVLTVKENLHSPDEQRAFLGDHLNLDFRRVSELCIVADSYGLLDREYRKKGEREIGKYGWSNALKLAYVRDPYDRREVWERACNGRPTASYRAVLAEIRHFRERKMIAPPAEEEEVETRLGAVRKMFSAFSGAAGALHSREDYGQALQELDRVQRELGQLKRALKDRFEAAEMEDLAASA